MDSVWLQWKYLASSSTGRNKINKTPLYFIFISDTAKGLAQQKFGCDLITQNVLAVKDVSKLSVAKYRIHIMISVKKGFVFTRKLLLKFWHLYLAFSFICGSTDKCTKLRTFVGWTTYMLLRLLLFSSFLVILEKFKS
jgi:hypothetical protein